MKRNESRAAAASFLRRIRAPLLTVGGALLTAFVIIPVLFNGIHIPAAVGAVEVEAPAMETAAPPPAVSASPGLAPSNADVAVSPSAPEEETGAEQMPTAAPTRDPSAGYSPLAFGDTAAAVKELQQRLMELWYMESDEPTDYFGPATEAAVKRFQRSHYMKETGVADIQLQSLLFSGGAREYVIEEGYVGEDVLSLQQRLDELGYYAEKRNGYFGTATRRALTAFQVKNGMAADGSADHDTRELVYSPDAMPAIDPTPTPTPTPTKTPKPTKTPAPPRTPGTTQSPAPPRTPGDAPSPTNTPGDSGGWGPGAGVEDTPLPSESADVSQTRPPIEVTPQETPTIAPTATAGGGIAPVGSGVNDFIAIAREQIGKPYKYSTEGPDSFDCSGLVYFALRSVGVKVGRYSAAGFSKMESWTTVYGKDNMRPGDLIFYKSDGGSADRITHVAIWLGGDKLLHASSSANKVCITDWGAWSERNFILAKRVF